MMLNRLSLNRIGLNRIGLNRIGKPSGGSSDRPYIDPKVLDSLCGVWIMDQNTNESESRNIIKNKIADRGGDLELLNFAYKANSGYNSYPEDFTSWGSLGAEVSKGGNKAKSININFRLQYTYSNFNRDVESFKVKISNFTKGILNYYYRQEDGTEKNFRISPKLVSDSNGVIELPKSYNTIEGGTGYKGGFLNIGEIDTNLTIEQLPLYEGALVTDGKDDIIVSQKTVQEMLGGSNVCTVVSMIHQINLSADVNTSINNIRSESVAHVCARHLNTAYGKTGIFGYSKQLNTTSNPTLINNILGDKKDYIADGNSVIDTTDKYFVQGYKYNDSLYELSEVAVYWTFISNKVLTTDEINQIIAYFKLDKYVTPQVIYDVKRQGLTNDTPAADWYLKDFSGNGHDMQLYNFAKKLGSGIGKYEVDFNTWIPQSYVADSAYTSNKLHITNIKGGNAILYTKKGANAMKVKITGIQSFNLVYRYIAENDVWEALEVDRDGIYELPASTTTTKYYTGFTVPYYTGDCDITIEQIPNYEGALVSDGIDDYGYADNLPIFKDYTVAIDRAWINLVGARAECLSTKNSDPDWGAFNFELSESIGRNTFSFGNTNQVSIDVDRKISYQSKYSYNGAAIAAGNIVDGKDLFLFRSRSAFPYYAEAAIWSYILFPYSLSEFLLERQLKKYKLGTLYPDMVEFRPVVKSNSEYQVVDFYIDNLPAVVGKYYPINSALRIAITTQGQVDEVSSIKVNGVDFGVPSINGNRFTFNGTLSDKSPQKINITIDEYIRFEDIVQPYPAIVNLSQNGKSISWGDKLKVDSEVAVTDYNILLPELYTHGGGIRYNGTTINLNAPIIVDKSMVFTNVHSWKLNTTEPHAIYSPQKLNIPNSSLKILGYIPDLTGKGNHGKLNNFAYTEDSGVAADGSIKFDGTDDHITIPTLAHGGKCVMMKVNWSNNGMLYDQRLNSSVYTFGILTGEATLAYNARNNGSTYIDGILNANIIPSDLVGITHNITAVNDAAIDNNTVSPRLGVSVSNATFSNQALYEFMLFPEIPSEDEIKKLNNVMGIEGGYVESPNYYWDSFGKSNNNKEDIDYDNLRQGTDANRQLIDKSVLGLKAIEDYIKTGNVSDIVSRRLYLNNVAYNSESGYTDDNGLLLDGVEDHAVNTAIPAVTDFTVIAKRTDLRTDGNIASFIQKGIFAGWNGGGAFSEGHWEGGLFYCSTFGTTRDINDVYNKELFWQTPTSYNGKSFEKGKSSDNSGLSVGVFINSVGGRTGYWKGVFYKMMLYTKTIDQLSINMLKNLFERDELIDVNNPIFKK